MKKSMVWIVLIMILAACNTSPSKSPKVFPEPLPQSQGEQLYLDMKCPACHGYQGAGDGFLAEGLLPKPVDFSSAAAMQSIPDTELEKAIRRGKGIGMPAYPQFTSSQVGALVRYIRSLSQPPAN